MRSLAAVSLTSVSRDDVATLPVTLRLCKGHSQLVRRGHCEADVLRQTRRGWRGWGTEQGAFVYPQPTDVSAGRRCSATPPHRCIAWWRVHHWKQLSFVCCVSASMTAVHVSSPSQAELQSCFICLKWNLLHSQCCNRLPSSCEGRV